METMLSIHQKANGQNSYSTQPTLYTIIQHNLHTYHILRTHSNSCNIQRVYHRVPCHIHSTIPTHKSTQSPYIDNTHSTYNTQPLHNSHNTCSTCMTYNAYAQHTVHPSWYTFHSTYFIHTAHTLLSISVCTPHIPLNYTVICHTHLTGLWE